MERVGKSTKATLLTHPKLPAGDRDHVEEFIRLCEGYAELERRILDNLYFDMPVHHVSIVGGSLTAIREEARALADAVRTLLELETPVSGFQNSLERHGVRTFQMPLSKTVSGVFLFASAIAPCVLINSRLKPGAVRFTLAHIYCHLLVDSDPYVPQVCSVSTQETDESEVRANWFAEELLLPESTAKPFMESDTAVKDMADYLDVPPSMVGERLARLGHTVSIGDPSDQWGRSRGVVYPERLVRLALEGIHEGRLDIGEFAEALGLSDKDAIELLRLSTAP